MSRAPPFRRRASAISAARYRRNATPGDLQWYHWLACSRVSWALRLAAAVRPGGSSCQRGDLPGGAREVGRDDVGGVPVQGQARGRRVRGFRREAASCSSLAIPPRPWVSGPATRLFMFIARSRCLTWSAALNGWRRQRQLPTDLCRKLTHTVICKEDCHGHQGPLFCRDPASGPTELRLPAELPALRNLADQELPDHESAVVRRLLG